MNRLGLLLLPILMISACSTTPEPEIRIIEKPVQVEVQHPPMPTPLEPEPIEWFVVVENNEPKYAAIQLQDVSTLVNNTAETGEYIKDLRSIIKYYRKIYASEEPSTDD